MKLKKLSKNFILRTIKKILPYPKLEVIPHRMSLRRKKSLMRSKRRYLMYTIQK